MNQALTPKIQSGITNLQKLVSESKTILVLQPEKPDTDSIGTSLALEQILGDLGKEVIMYCQDPVPDYLRIFNGWDRISDQFPPRFDITLAVDFGDPQQMERTLAKHGTALQSKPFIILDHHKTRKPMAFPSIDIIDPETAATGELVVKICNVLGWDINLEAAQAIVPAILADTLGLSTPTTTAQTVDTVAQMVRIGVDLSDLRRRREIAGALDPEILKYKGELLQRVEYFAEGRIALVVITPAELKLYAEKHDPADLINQEIRTVKGVQIAAIMRDYDSSLYGRKIKISMRANVPIAALAAAHFGGGGHDQAAGCTVEGRQPDDVKTELVKVITPLLQNATI
jgi:bifunctional oligoribonuclease and PAP phosphatase NrnA